MRSVVACLPTTDTKSRFLIQLASFWTDIIVIKHITVGDNIDLIISGLSESFVNADCVIVTGGLGPTDDDNTVEAVCRIFNRSIISDEQAENRMTDFFKSMKIRINDSDYKMATVPSGSIVLKNTKVLRQDL
jgi:nicotinamide-nucleotide amidase